MMPIRKIVQLAALTLLSAYIACGKGSSQSDDDIQEGDADTGTSADGSACGTSQIMCGASAAIFKATLLIAVRAKCSAQVGRFAWPEIARRPALQRKQTA